MSRRKPTAALTELVECQRKINAERAEQERIQRAADRKMQPSEARERVAGERANQLWVQVLDEYGPGGPAQDALRTALAAAGVER